MGGDLAPQAPVVGTVEALRRNPELTVTLAGIVPEIEKYLAGADDVRPGTRAELVRGGIGGTHAHKGKVPAVANAQRLLHPARAAQDLARIAVLVPLFFVRRVERRPGGPGDGVALQVESVLGGGAHDTGQAPHDGAGVFALPGQGGQALHKLVVVDVYIYADHGYPVLQRFSADCCCTRKLVTRALLAKGGRYPGSNPGGNGQRIFCSLRPRCRLLRSRR